jgi:hypothetical protein
MILFPREDFDRAYFDLAKVNAVLQHTPAPATCFDSPHRSQFSQNL